MFPTNSRRKASAATSKPRRSSPSAFASNEHCSRVEHAAVQRFQSLLERRAYGAAEARSNIRPLERGKVLQFGLGKSASHKFSSNKTTSTKQIGRRRTNRDRELVPARAGNRILE